MHRLWKGTVSQLTLDIVHISKWPSREWEFPGEPHRDQLPSPTTTSTRPLRNPSSSPQLPQWGSPWALSYQEESNPKVSRAAWIYHQIGTTKELVNGCHVARLWNATGTYFRISLFQKKANGALLFSAPKSGHVKQTEIIQDFGPFWNFGLLMRASQKSS